MADEPFDPPPYDDGDADPDLALLRNRATMDGILARMEAAAEEALAQLIDRPDDLSRLRESIAGLLKDPRGPLAKIDGLLLIWAVAFAHAYVHRRRAEAFVAEHDAFLRSLNDEGLDDPEPE